MQHRASSVVVVFFILALAIAPSAVTYFCDPQVSGRAAELIHSQLTTSKAGTFKSPTEFVGKVGKYRWKVKMDEDPPITPTKVITIAEIATWSDLKDIHEDSPRQLGNERQFFETTGKVMLVKAEDDGDLHVQLTDGKHELVVEVPVGKPWEDIRKEVFSWAEVTFPCGPHELKLTKHPRITVVGKAFYDGQHKSKKQNRRSYDDGMLVWEIHPVMVLEVE